VYFTAEQIKMLRVGLGEIRPKFSALATTSTTSIRGRSTPTASAWASPMARVRRRRPV
jgi:hypothetical protein